MNVGSFRSHGLVFIAAAWCAVLLGTGCAGKEGASGGGATDSVATAASSNDAFRSSAVPAQINDSTGIVLRCRVRRGEVYHFRESVKIDLQGEFAVSGPRGEKTTPSTGQQRSTFCFTVRVDSTRPDSSTAITFSFDSINVAMESEQGTKSFNSVDTAQMRDPQYALWASLVNLPVHVVVTARGEVSTIDGLDAAVTKVAQLQGQTDSVPQQVREMMREQFGEGTIKPILQHVFPQYTERAVKVNDPWNLTFEAVIEGTFPTENTVNYRITNVGAEGNHRTADIASELAVRVKKTHQEDSTAQVSLKNGQFGGEAKTTIDVDRGIVVRRTASLWQSIEMLSVGRGRYAGGNGHITKNVKNVTTVERY